MKDDSCNKIRLLRVWELLKKETDEDNPMSTTEIIRRLKEEGLKCNRATLYSDINLLNKYGYEIQRVRSTFNLYYVYDRDFNNPEIQIMMDAVKAASFVTKKKTNSLVNKIAQLAGSKKGEILKKNILEFNTVKSNNERIYYSVDDIINAITQKKKLSFVYYDYGVNKSKVYRKTADGENEIKTYIVNPVATICSDDKYYLVCFSDAHLDFTPFRIDRMEEVKMLDEDVTCTNAMDPKAVANKLSSMFKMYGGKKERIVFSADKKVLNSVYDKFNDGVKTLQDNGNKVLLSVEMEVSNPLISWFIGFGNMLQVLKPQCVVDSIKELVKKASEVYSD